MKRNFWTSLLLIFLGLVMMAGAASRIGTINKQRIKYNFDPTDPITDRETAAKLRLPTVALFTFRSLLIDYLWIRAENLKDQGQYFDAMHLSRLICALQPNLPTVWDFQGWNMAFNLSVAMPNPPERWHWIEAGINLLREEGLAAVPRSPELYQSLGHIFATKIAGTTDDFHRYYKKRLAFDMMELLGAGVVTNAELRAMAAMPRRWEQLKADPNVVELAQQIIAAEPRFNNEPQMLEGLRQLPSFPTDYDPKLHQVLEDHNDNYALNRLTRFIKTRHLRDVWKLEPEMMLQINAQYGPLDYENEGRRLSLDWRLAQCHAIYWALRGLEYTTDTGITWLDLRRLLHHNLQSLFYNGNLHILNTAHPETATAGTVGQEIFDRAARTEVEIYNSMDMRMFSVAFGAMMDTIELSLADDDQAPVGVSSAASYLTWNLIVDSYLAGHEKLSRSAYLSLQQQFPENIDYQISMEDFIRNRLYEEQKGLTSTAASQYIESLLRSSFELWALRNDDLSAAREKRARQIHRQLELRLGDVTVDRQTLPEYPQMKVISLKNFLLDPMIDVGVKRLLFVRLEQERPEESKRLKAELDKEQLKIIL
ncbi:hypothetical protein ACFL02_00840 [Planctomycetota bacterium]